MQNTGGSILNGNNEDMLFTYDEEERQDIEIAKANSKMLFTPEFIPYYIKDVKVLGLTPTEAIVYGFIRFYLSNNSKRFYFSSEDISTILDISVGTVDNIFSKLTKLQVIETGRKVKAGGGTIRFINKFIGISTSSNNEVIHSDLINQGGLTSSNNEIHINKNNIKYNNIYSSKEEYNNVHCKGDIYNKDVCSININNKEIDKLSSCSIKKEERKKKEEIVTDDVFNGFWKQYPRKTNKVEAKKSMEKHIKSIDDLWLCGFGLFRFNEINKLKGTEINFIPHASTWLNQERFRDFEDEYNELKNNPNKAKDHPFFKKFELNTLDNNSTELKDDDIVIKYKRTYDNN